MECPLVQVIVQLNINAREAVRKATDLVVHEVKGPLHRDLLVFDFVAKVSHLLVRLLCLGVIEEFSVNPITQILKPFLDLGGSTVVFKTVMQRLDILSHTLCDIDARVVVQYVDNLLVLDFCGIACKLRLEHVQLCNGDFVLQTVLDLADQAVLNSLLLTGSLQLFVNRRAQNLVALEGILETCDALLLRLQLMVATLELSTQLGPDLVEAGIRGAALQLTLQLGDLIVDAIVLGFYLLKL